MLFRSPGVMESSSEDEEGRTFVQVVSEKYSPENFPYCRGNRMGVVLLPSPKGSPVKGQRSSLHYMDVDVRVALQARNIIILYISYILYKL